MGTRGYQAYRYKKKYYRLYTHGDSYPSYLGDKFAQIIPRDAAAREAWVEREIKSLEETAQPTEASTEAAGNDLQEAAYEGYEILDDNDWILGDMLIEWTYVIDLDNRAFTVMGQLHFDLDNMPPRELGISHYLEDDGSLEEEIPQKYLTTVSQWPNPSFDVEKALLTYDSLRALVVPLQEWGAPTWDNLTISQRLSAKLVKTITSDHKRDLSNPDISATHQRIAFICWKIACAAAPSHLLCPPEDATLSEKLLYTHSTNVLSRQPVPNYVQGHCPMHVYCWFRGCLVTFCPRLGEDLYVKHEVGLMAEKLRRQEPAGGIGIVLSSHQMVAVAVENAQVRHSPTLDVHDTEGNIRDGLLLLMHLLGPTSTVPKDPWASGTTAVQTSGFTPALPEELIRYIVHMTDYESRYFTLPLVSHSVRSMCLDHPLIGEYTLLSVGRDETFKVLRSADSSIIETSAKLTRTDKKRILRGLLGTFQYHQTGKGETNSYLGEPRRGCVDWRKIVKGDQLSAMRIQIVEGIWGMVELGAELVEGPGEI